MTLITALFSHKKIIQLSDRRTSMPDGTVVEDEFNKAIMIRTLDTSTLMGFTGIASTGIGFSTTNWVVETLKGCAEPDFYLKNILERFCVKATEYFKTSKELSKISVDQRSLVIGFSGYRFTVPPSPFFIQVANGNDPADPLKFELTEICPTDDESGSMGCAALYGQPTLISISEMAPLETMLKEDRPVEAIVDKTVELFNSAMKKGSGGRTIGPQISSIAITKDAPTGFKIGYHTGTTKTKIPCPILLHLLPGNINHQDWTLEPVGDHPLTKNVPKVHKKAACPCGSNIQYRNCHGRVTAMKIAHKKKLGL